jgi:hypothetical protein
MIFNFMINILIGTVKLILGILPNVVATPQAIVDGGDWVITTISGVISVLSMVLSAPLLAACVVVIIGMFTFEWIYHSVMWILRKIPMVNIK